MAAGRNGGYRSNGFGDRASIFDVSRRGFVRARKEYDHSRNGNREIDRDFVREVRDRVGGRKKYIKERGMLKGGDFSSPSRSDSDSSRAADCGRGGDGFPGKIVDREPGELSTDSGSDSDDVLESGMQVQESEVLKLVENGSQTPSERKRKFSPIVWDKEEKVVSISCKSRVTAKSTSLPPQPSLLKVDYQSTNGVTDAGDRTSLIENGSTEDLESFSLGKTHMGPRSNGYAMSYSAGRMSSISPKEQWKNTLETEDISKGDHAPTRNISSSRWAAENYSPNDEGEIKLPPTSSADTRRCSESLSPEFGELKRQALEAARVRSSESGDRSVLAESLSGDDYFGKDPENDDYMDVDEERGRNDTSISQSDIDLEDDIQSCAKLEPAAPLRRSVNMLQGCRSVDEYERLNKINEGTYGVVYRARDKKTEEIVALKKVKMEKEREGFPLTSLREINILLAFHHPAIVDVKEVVVGHSLDSIFMVMEYMEHDLKGLMETMKHPYSQSEVKCLMLQLLEGMKYLHDNWVLHRDLKTSNLLLNNRGELKICDFGLARQYGSPLKPYTHLVVTLWYRAPELLLGAKQYSTAIDMWSLGCIMAELLTKEPLFNGKTEVDQLDKIFRILGTPNETIWPGVSKLPGVRVNFVKHQYNLLRKKFPAASFTGSPVLSDSGFDLLNKLLTYDPEKRITAEAALNHEWFREVPLPKSKEFMPTFPAQNAQDRRMRRVMRSPDPLEEQHKKELHQAEFGSSGLFG